MLRQFRNEIRSLAWRRPRSPARGSSTKTTATATAGSRTSRPGPARRRQFSFTQGNNRIDGYSYDAAGNLLNDGSNSYTYDAENRLISVGGSVSYVYDGDGRRVRKTVSGTSVDFLYDLGINVVAEMSSTGSWNRGEVYAGGRHLATYNQGTTFFNHSDWLGTERARTGVNGPVSETCQSLPFGDGQSCSGTDSSPNHFTRKEPDTESGLCRENAIAKAMMRAAGRAYESRAWTRGLYSAAERR